MSIKEVSIKQEMPTVREAMEILDLEIKRAKNLKYDCIKIIHGYGSTGTGGKIKTKLREVLPQKIQEGQIKDFVRGEDWSIFNPKTREILNSVKDARGDKDLDKFNIGMTVIIL